MDTLYTASGAIYVLAFFAHFLLLGTILEQSEDDTRPLVRGARGLLMLETLCVMGILIAHRGYLFR